MRAASLVRVCQALLIKGVRVVTNQTETPGRELEILAQRGSGHLAYISTGNIADKYVEYIDITN